MRTVEDMIAGRNAPRAPGAAHPGIAMTGLRSHQCRFPLSGQGVATLFCAAQVADDDWRPSRTGGCYCNTHRDLTSGRGTPAERAAPRVLERLG